MLLEEKEKAEDLERETKWEIKIFKRMKYAKGVHLAKLNLEKIQQIEREIEVYEKKDSRLLSIQLILCFEALLFVRLKSWRGLANAIKKLKVVIVG